MSNATTCPSCQQTMPGQLWPVDLPVLGGRDGEVAFIHRETHRLDQLIMQLNEEKATLLRRLNAIQSPTITLPTETLSSIFEYACPPPDFSERHTFPSYTEYDIVEISEYQYFQFTLGAVSSHWRQVVQSSPHLWAWTALDITTPTAEKKAAFLRFFIENSKEVPFTLALQFSQDVDPWSSYLVHQTIDNLLIEALPRIKELHLVNPPREWHNYTLHLSQLRDCSLNLSRPERFTPDGRVMLPLNAPLRRFSLREALWRSNTNIQLPWTTITSLKLSYIAPDHSVQVLIQCPNLIDFRCFSPSRRQPPPSQVTLSNPISFQHLVDFNWETDDSPWSRALIRYLNLPALKEMYWNTFHSDNNDIQTFFNRLPPTLETVVLEITTSHLDYISDDSNIENLALRSCTTRDITTLFQRLRPSLREGQVVKPLPRLKRVIIGWGVRNENTMAHVSALPPSYSTALVEMLEQRLDESNNSFIIEMETVTFGWTPSALARVRELVNRGFGVEIIEGLDDF